MTQGYYIISSKFNEYLITYAQAGNTSSKYYLIN